jgi:hypothetical protein
LSLILFPTWIVVININFGSTKVIQWVPRRHKVLTHWQERIFRKVTSVSIHSFVEWLDTFSYVLRPAEVTVQEVHHITVGGLQLTLQKILYSFPVILLWNTCACCNWRQNLQRVRLSPHGLNWPTVNEGLDTAALTSASLMSLGRRNATTGGSGNNLASVSLFSVSFQWWRTMPEIFSKERW